MKRVDLIRHLLKQGCRLEHEGSKHTLFSNPRSHTISTVPRHVEIDTYLARKICKDLFIEKPKKKS